MVAIKGVTSIADDLLTDNPNKALSAAQGVVLKQELASAGGGVSPTITGFNESPYECATVVEFSRDTTQSSYINGLETSAVTDENNNKYTIYSINDTVTTNNLIGINFTPDAKTINRSQVVLEWNKTAGKQDEISRARLSRNGGQSWAEVQMRQSGFKEYYEETLAENTSTNYSGDISITATNVNLAQGFQIENKAVIYSADVYIYVSGNPGGRFRLGLRTDNSGPSSTVLSHTDWQNVSDVATTIAEHKYSFINQAVYEPSTQYHLVLELENSDHYYTSGELKWGVSAGTYTDGTAYTGNGTTFTSVPTDDFIFSINGKRVIQETQEPISYGEAVFTKAIHYDKNATLIEYAPTSGNILTSLNLTDQQLIAQRFCLDKKFAVTEVELQLKRTGTPSGNIQLSVYSDATSGDIPSLLTEDAITCVNSNSILTTEELQTFTFNDLELNENTNYWFALSSYEYLYDTSNYIDVGTNTEDLSYLPGAFAKGSGTVWTADSGTIVFKISGAYQDETIISTTDSSAITTYETLGTSITRSLTVPQDSVFQRVDLALGTAGTLSGDLQVDIDEGATTLATSEVLTASDLISGDATFNFLQNTILEQGTAYTLKLRTDTEQVGSGSIISWISGTAGHCYTAYGIESDLLLEITGRKVNAELAGLSAWYGFNESYVQDDPSTTEVQLDSAMKATGSVPYGGLVVSPGRGQLQAMIQGHAFIGGIDFLEMENIAKFDPTDLIGQDTVIFQKIRQGQIFSSPILEIQDRARALPDPVIEKYDIETIEFRSTGGANAFKVELPDGTVLVGSDNLRCSFSNSKNQYGGLGLETGSEGSDTEYYMYAVKRAGTTRDLAIVFSPTKPSGGGPMGYRYWKYLGRFWNDGSGDIEYPFSSTVKLWGMGGWASAATMIGYWTSSVTTKGTNDLSYVFNDSTNGDSITINRDGIATIGASMWAADGGSKMCGVSRNASSLTTGLGYIIPPERLLLIYFNHSTGSVMNDLYNTVHVKAGDIIRGHTNAADAKTNMDMLWVEFLPLTEDYL